MAELTLERIASLLNPDKTFKTAELLAAFQALVDRPMFGISGEAKDAAYNATQTQSRLDRVLADLRTLEKTYSSSDGDTLNAISTEFEVISEIASVLGEELEARQEFAARIGEVAERQEEIAGLIRESSDYV